MKYQILLYNILLACLFVGCSLDVDIEDRATDPDAISDYQSGERALASAYQNFGEYSNIITLNLMSDDVLPSPLLSQNPSLMDTYKWKAYQLVTMADGMWVNDYATIMYVNVLLERLSSLTFASDKDMEKVRMLLAEGNGLKGLCMLNLMRLFSPRYTVDNENLPLGIIAKDHVQLERLSRMTIKATADSIDKCLHSLLATDQQQNVNRFHMNKTAAQCVAMELYMWKGEYEKVLSITDKMLSALDDHVFETVQYEKLWHQENGLSDEVIFAYDLASIGVERFFDDWGMNGEGDYMVVNDNISYDENDIRKKSSIIPYNFPIDHATSHRMVHLMGKYNSMRSNREVVRYIPIYRWADVIFAAAEASARLGHNDKAVTIINRLLARRQAKLLSPALKGNQLIQQILYEKQKEFLCEGKRFFDMKRVGNIEVKRSILFDDGNASSIPANDFRWTFPVPASEYRYNDKITQINDWLPYLPKPQQEY